jgi:glyceraldehyde 3-phosphate dehydrogenase
MRVGINGMGRIGRLALRAAMGAAERPEDDPRAGNRLDVVHLNEIKGGAAATAHLLEFDSVQGRWRAPIAAEGDGRHPHRRPRLGFSEHARRRHPLGRSRRRRRAGMHRQVPDAGDAAGASRPRREARDRRRAGEVRQRAQRRRRGERALYDPARHPIVTAASCTTNCLAPVVKVVHEAIGIRHGQITTIHDPTNTNVVVDAPHKDLRRARSPCCPAADHDGQRDGHRADLSRAEGQAERPCGARAGAERLADRLRLRDAARDDAEEVNALFRAAAAGPLAGILGYEERGRWSAPTTRATRAAPSSTRPPPWSPTARC